MSDDDRKVPDKHRRREVDAFLKKVAATPAVKAADERGRLVFALDATASREPTWDRASHIQAQMFEETAALGGLEIQLCYYRGYGEFHAHRWLSDGPSLLEAMTAVTCRGGQTQIEKVLAHTIQQTRQKKVNALVFVGDCMEEDVDRLCTLAGQLGLLGVPAFLFHEGTDPAAARTFGEIARLTGGAYCAFDANSPRELRDLLRAVAVYAAGGPKALSDFSRRAGGNIPRLVHQIEKRKG